MERNIKNVDLLTPIHSCDGFHGIQVRWGCNETDMHRKITERPNGPKGESIYLSPQSLKSVEKSFKLDS